MDGKRRVARPVRRSSQQPDCRLAYRVAARLGAVMFLGTSIVSGILQGGHLNYAGSPWLKIPGKLSSVIGLAADDIRISGLDHHDPALLLATIGVHPGGSLVGFNASMARQSLEALDWVSGASVRRVFPNQLEISLTEREPFAVWQHDGRYSVIDREGEPMSGLDPSTLGHFPLVSGEKANIAVAELVNQLETVPALKEKVFAAARIGGRRWTLYLSNGVKVALPEMGVEAALKSVADADAEQGLLSKGITAIDLRVADQFAVVLASVTAAKEPSAASAQKQGGAN